MENLSENVKTIKEKINRAKRDDQTVFLCAACKTQTPEVIRKSANLQIDIFGENRVQELLRNFEENVYLEKPLHFIGHLQTNKVKMIVGKCSVIESVDSVRLALEINKQAEKMGIVQEILIEVNIGGEESKSGVLQKDFFPLLKEILTLKNIKVVGLMTIPPKCENPREYFKKMKMLFEKAKEEKGFEGKYLSMGMSGDFEIAIEEGANIVRVGTAIYGKREY